MKKNNSKEDTMTNPQTKQGHTPGPWEEGRSFNPYRVYGNGGKEVVARVEERANARLIAAAPALLEAAQEALHWLKQLNCDDNDGAVHLLTTAIRSAEAGI